MGDGSHSAPLTLFLELEQGKSVNLESAARIALAWNDLIVEIFAILDPDAVVRIDLIDAVEGSLAFRSIVRAVSRVAKQNPLLAGVIAAIVGIFFLKPAEDAASLFWKAVYEAVGEVINPDPASPERVEFDNKVQIAQRDNVANRQKRQLFVELEREPVIVGAGAFPSHTVKPPIVLPRSEFVTRAGVISVSNETIQRRTMTRRMNVILLTAKLEPKQLMWRFADDTGEPFSAKMTDPKFIQALEEGRTGGDLKIGLMMDIELETKQESVSGFWSDNAKSVTHVYSPTLPPAGAREPQFFDDE